MGLSCFSYVIFVVRCPFDHGMSTTETIFLTRVTLFTRNAFTLMTQSAILLGLCSRDCGKNWHLLKLVYQSFRISRGL